MVSRPGAGANLSKHCFTQGLLCSCGFGVVMFFLVGDCNIVPKKKLPRRVWEGQRKVKEQVVGFGTVRGEGKL